VHEDQVLRRRQPLSLTLCPYKFLLSQSPTLSVSLTSTLCVFRLSHSPTLCRPSRSLFHSSTLRQMSGRTYRGPWTCARAPGLAQTPTPPILRPCPTCVSRSPASFFCFKPHTPHPAPFANQSKTYFLHPTPHTPHPTPYTIRSEKATRK